MFTADGRVAWRVHLQAPVWPPYVAPLLQQPDSEAGAVALQMPDVHIVGRMRRRKCQRGSHRRPRMTWTSCLAHMRCCCFCLRSVAGQQRRCRHGLRGAMESGSSWMNTEVASKLDVRQPHRAVKRWRGRCVQPCFAFRRKLLMCKCWVAGRTAACARCCAHVHCLPRGQYSIKR